MGKKWPFLGKNGHLDHFFEGNYTQTTPRFQNIDTFRAFDRSQTLNLGARAGKTPIDIEKQAFLTFFRKNSDFDKHFYPCNGLQLQV